jgi:hypothetical protein
VLARDYASGELEPVGAHERNGLRLSLLLRITANMIVGIVEGDDIVVDDDEEVSKHNHHLTSSKEELDNFGPTEQGSSPLCFL